MDNTQVLFESGVPLVIHSGEREDTHTVATVKLSLAVRSPIHRKVLHAQLTDDSDPFFFLSLDVTEEDFQILKNEQNLKPDFANFPAKVIELLQQCVACASEKYPSYTAELTNKNNQTTLQIIKTDDFKNLITLSLVFRPGNDVTVKKYLAEKLGEFKNASISLKKSLDDTRASLTKRAEIAEARAAELGRSLDERVAESNRALAELRAEMTSHLAAERERTLLTSQDILRKGEDDRKGLMNKYESTNASLNQTIHRLEQENKDLLDAKYRLEADVKDITAQLHATKVELSHCKQEMTTLRAENKALDGAMHEHEKNVTGHKIKISAVEQHISDKDELISKMSALLDSTNAQKASVEESLTLVKNNLKEAEERVATLRSEIKKGNQIIATLQTALKTRKSKSAEKGELVQKLQSDLAAKDSQILGLQGDASKLHAQREGTQHEMDILRETEASLKLRLEECKQIISNNNNVIEFLQKDLLRQKEGTLPSSSGSNYLFSGSADTGLSASAYKFRPKYTSPMTKSTGYTGSSTPFSTTHQTPLTNSSTNFASNVLKTTNTATTNMPTSHTTPSNPSAYPPSTYSSHSASAYSSSHSTHPSPPSTFTPHSTHSTHSTHPSPPSTHLPNANYNNRPSTPKSVLYNPPASQLRSFAPSN